MTLSPVQVQWLSLIRYQARQGDEQSRQPPPLNMIAVNSFHDAVESMFGLVTDVRRIATPKGEPRFLDLFALVDADLSNTLGHHQGRLKRLNAVRIGFKHHSNYVDSRTIERLREYVFDFLAEVSTLALGLNFDNVSLAGLISDAESRALAESAQTRWTRNEHHLALTELRKAFDRLIRAYEEGKTWGPTRSLFETKPPGAAYRAARARQAAEFGAFGDSAADYHQKWLSAIDHRLKLLAFGVDLRGYAYLDAHAPFPSGRIGAASDEIEIREGAPTPTDTIFHNCLRFVIDTALRLDAFDFEFDAWPGPARS